MSSDVCTPTSLALQLPEIMGLIAGHLSPSSINNCQQVSRSWNSIFTPFVWRQCFISAHKSMLGFTLDALRKHAHLIRELEFHGPIPTSYFTVNCTQLEYLSFSGTRRDWNAERYDDDDFDMNEAQSRDIADPIIRLVQSNPGLKKLMIYGLNPLPTAEFWEVVSNLKNIEKLFVNKIAIPAEHTNSFWKAISAHPSSLRLNVEFLSEDINDGTPVAPEYSSNNLDIDIGHGLNVPHTQDVTLKPQRNSSALCNSNFARLKDLYVFRLHGKAQQKSIFENCPLLESLYWKDNNAGDFPLSLFTSALQTGALSRLHALELRSTPLSDDDLYVILTSINQLTKLVIPGSGIADKTMLILFKHSATVKELNLSGCLLVRSWMNQAILSSFPLLESFSADTISVQDIMDGEPWICTGLKMLRVEIEIGCARVMNIWPNGELPFEVYLGDDLDNEVPEVGNNLDTELLEVTIELEPRDSELFLDNNPAIEIRSSDIVAKVETYTDIHAETASDENSDVTETELCELDIDVNRVDPVITHENHEYGSMLNIMAEHDNSRALSGKDTNISQKITISGVAEENDTFILGGDSDILFEESVVQLNIVSHEDLETNEKIGEIANERKEEGYDDDKEEDDDETDDMDSMKQFTVYDRLSGLHQLQVLNINTVYISGPTQAEYEAGVRREPVVLDLRLKRGLDKLKALKNLRSLSTLFKLRKQSPQKNQVNDHQKPVVAHDLLFLPDFLFPVFSCLDRKSVFTVRQVCQQWNAVGRQFISLRTHWQDNLTQFQKRAIIMQLKLFDTLEIIDGDDSWVKFCDFAGETNAMAESSRRSNGAISNDLLIGLQALSAAEDPNTYNDEGCKGQARSGGQRSRLRKLVVTRAQRYEKRLQDLLGVLPMLTSLELVDLIITKIEMHSILSSTPNLQRFIVEYTLGDVVSWDPPMSNDTQQSTSTTTSIAGSPTRSAYIHGLETLIIRHAAMDQVSLESLCEALPRLTELEVRFLHLTPIDGSDGVFSRKSFYQSLARSCPRIESLHFSLYHREMNVEESVALQHSFPALKELSMAGKDLDDIGLGHQIKLLEYYTNYLTKLEILCYSARHGNRFLERFHQFLCSARHLRHLIAPKLQYWTEYMDLEEINNSNHDTDDSGNSRGNGQVYYRPRDDAHRQYMEWKIPARRWACRDLETLHLGFTARFGSSTDAEHSRIMFGYISRYCPQLRDLQINKQMLNLHIDGGLCLLTRLKHLEKLKINGTKAEVKVGRHPYIQTWGVNMTTGPSQHTLNRRADVGRS
ncbi:hypothetical protein BGX27_007822 [Mortierella sp. AM989]|nr:hypothetical protein BGX27_007822 [Mortierella sp. AM989]